jgi:alcohol dehydrogenase
MDCAKGINFLLTNGGRMEDYWGFGKAEKPLLPSVGIPTTAGTGSDAQSYALISQQGSHRKMACGDRGARFRVVLLDPVLLASAPREVVADAGLDAIAHAVETLVSRRRTPISTMLSREAWRQLDGAFETVLSAAGGDGAGAAAADAWGRMLLGAHLAGAAIEASMLGAAHACANPLTARYGLVHGVAVALMLPAVVRFNAQQVDDLYRQLLPGGGEALARRLEALGRLAGLPRGLAAAGVEEEALDELAARAADEWTGGFNPRPVAVDELLELYRAAF